MTSDAPASPAVQRQIVLPTSKALEIAYKSIRLRLSRSLLVTSGIVLALAFLMSIRTTQKLIEGMRGWEHQLNDERTAAAKKITDAAQDVQKEVDVAHVKPVEGADVKAAIGEDLPSLQKEFGSLPVAGGLLAPAIAVDPQVATAMKNWIDANHAFSARRQAFSDAQSLEQVMASKGVPTSQADIDSDAVQTRWLLSLALMVAFVGILNSMLMSVTERFREIGTMKCLGALDSFIIKLFLIESLFQGVVGTIVGIICGLALSFASAAGSYDGYVWKNLPVAGILTSIAMCLVIGIGLTVAGAVYPAWQAARMQPIEAMRAET
jgi:hypothetical protein